MHYSYGNGPLNYPSRTDPAMASAPATADASPGDDGDADSNADVKMMTGIFTLVSVSMLYMLDYISYAM